MRVQVSIISLHGFQFNGLEPLLRPFPACLDGDRDLAEAFLVHMSCMEAMLYLHSFTKELLAGKPSLSSMFFPGLDID